MSAVTFEDELQEKIRLTLPKVIGDRIREARNGLGETLDVFAEDLGTNRSHIIKLEKGKQRPHARTLLKIATKTKRDPDWFLDPEVDPASHPFRDGQPGAADA